jgi:hypothetical protein
MGRIALRRLKFYPTLGATRGGAEERAMSKSFREACESVGNPTNEMALVGMERDLSPADLRAVRRGIGAALRTLYSNELREEIPDRIAELLRQLDQQL